MAKKTIKNSEPKSATENSYTAKDIYVLEGLEPVRKRPGMYIGSTGKEGLHHLIWEVVDNSLDEAMAGYAKNIEVRLLKNNRVSVLDDGRGIPTEIHPQTKKSALETVMCTLHAGAKFGGQSYKVAGGLHGVGVSVVNALSKYLKAEVCYQGTKYYQEYSRGKPTTKVIKNGSCSKSGTLVIFEPDSSIFSELNFDFKTIIDHLREQAYLTRGVTIRVFDEREGASIPSYLFHFESGIITYIQYLTRNSTRIQKEIFYTKKEIEGTEVEVALCYIDDTEAMELSFANNIRTNEGGSHLTGFRSALTRTLNDYAKKAELIKNEELTLTGEDVREGLVAIISVKLREPQFEGQTKAKLGNPEVRTRVEQILNESFSEFLEKNREDARRIIEKCLLSARARKAAKAAKENVLRKGALEGSSLPGKLADCISRKPSESELFIVEGESAGGSTKSARDRHHQAVLPLRGKILNVEKARFDKMMTSEEIRNLIIALGTAISEEFNIDKIRYHKIIIATDADTDGAHIRTLLLTLFYRYFREVIERGYLYIAQPPLYRIQKGKNVYYAYTESQKDKILKEISAEKKEGLKKLKLKDIKDEEATFEVTEESKELKGIDIQRYKGLGEMNPQQLWETTMDPERRLLKQITIKDAEEADRLFDILMGDKVLPRKKFIQAYASKVKNLDI